MHRNDGIPQFTELLRRCKNDPWVTLRMTVALGNLACDNPENRDMIRSSIPTRPLPMMQMCRSDEISREVSREVSPVRRITCPCAAFHTTSKTCVFVAR